MKEQKELEEELVAIEAEFGVEISKLRKEQSKVVAFFLEGLRQKKIDDLKLQLGADQK